MKRNRRVTSSSVCLLLYVCTMQLVVSAAGLTMDRCVTELCGGGGPPGPLVSDSCVAACRRWITAPDNRVLVDDTTSLKRAPNFIRIGKAPLAAVGGGPSKRYSSFVPVGRQRPASGDKRYSSFVRIGRANAPPASAGALSGYDHRLTRIPTGVNRRRYSSFVRVGRNAAD